MPLSRPYDNEYPPILVCERDQASPFHLLRGRLTLVPLESCEWLLLLELPQVPDLEAPVVTPRRQQVRHIPSYQRTDTPHIHGSGPPLLRCFFRPSRPVRCALPLTLFHSPPSLVSLWVPVPAADVHVLVVCRDGEHGLALGLTKVPHPQAVVRRRAHKHWDTETGTKREGGRRLDGENRARIVTGRKGLVPIYVLVGLRCFMRQTSVLRCCFPTRTHLMPPRGSIAGPRWSRCAH